MPKAGKNQEEDYAMVHKNCLKVENNLRNLRAGEISRVVDKASLLFNATPPKSDEEVSERLNWYFQMYIDDDTYPTVEGMSLALGVVRETVHNWEHGKGCSPLRMDMIRKAKQIIAECDAQLALHGKFNPVMYIFRAKNYYGMRDQVEQVTTITPVVPIADSESLKQKYLQDMCD